MMTKKQFIELAEIMRELKPDIEWSKEFDQWRDTIDSLSLFCKRQNPNFDEKRWTDYINKGINK
jgi:hypothetical protein